MPPDAMTTPFQTLTPARKVRIALHPGQKRALASAKRFILALAGWQSGKTVIGPPWLLQEIRARSPGDYLVASPSYPLMTKKVLPEFLRLFRQQLKLGSYVGGAKNVFTFSADGCWRTFGRIPDDPVQVFFAHASNPEALESATYKAAWIDEGGQRIFRLASFEAILGRLSIAQGRVLITSRPYDLGWLKQTIYDPWIAAGRNHPLIDVINFRSLDNPVFPRAERDRAKQSLPGWKFRMKYEGHFTKPAGMIYDCFDETHKVPRFKVPAEWPRYLGIDFGGVNTAAVFFAEEVANGNPTGKLYAYREYKAGGRTAAGHAAALLAGEPGIPQCVGGSKSEGQWRDEFRAAGLPVREPAVAEVEVGIDRVYGTIQRGELYVFDDLAGLLDELGSYSRELDDMGEPTEKIADKETYHELDATRYCLGWLKGGAVHFGTSLPDPSSRSLIADAPEGVFLT